MSGSRDPGDAVPPGVAPQTPAPLTEEDRAVRDRLEELSRRKQDPSEDPEAQTGSSD